MRARRSIILAAATLLAPVALAFSPPQPAWAAVFHVKSFNMVCGLTLSSQCNLSMNGVNGHGVYAETADNDDARQNVGYSFIQAPGCPSGVSKVQDFQDGDDNCKGGPSQSWPFQSADSCNTKSPYDTGNVVDILSGSGLIAYNNASAGNDVDQSNDGDIVGHLWDKYPSPSQTGYENVVNVSATDSHSGVFTCDPYLLHNDGFDSIVTSGDTTTGNNWAQYST